MNYYKAAGWEVKDKAAGWEVHLSNLMSFNVSQVQNWFVDNNNIGYQLKEFQRVLVYKDGEIMSIVFR